MVDESLFGFLQTWIFFDVVENTFTLLHESNENSYFET